MLREPGRLIFTRFQKKTRCHVCTCVKPDRILDCLASATFGQLLELAGSLPDAIVLRAEVATSSSFLDAKAVSLETPMLVCQCVSVGVYFLFRPTNPV